MTIIAPKNNKNNLWLLIASLALPMLILAYWSVSIYNQTVSLKHALNSAQSQLQELKSTNADIKNQLYQLTDSGSLIRFGEERGLVKIKSPSWSAVSDLQ